MSDKVVLNRKPKNLEGVSTRENEIFRGVYPEPAEGLKMTLAGLRWVGGQPLEGNFCNWL